MQTETINQKTRIIYADIIRIVAILLIVLLHTSAYWVGRSEFGSQDWWIGHIVDSITRGGVSLFVMLSGMLLLAPSRDEKLSTFFRKRFIKVLIPYLIWSAFYIILNIVILKKSLSAIEIIQMIVGFNADATLWFIGMILGLYLITPIIKIYVNNAKDGNLLYFLIIWFIFTGIFPIITNFSAITEIGLSGEFAVGYVGYYVLGYYLSRQTNEKKYRLICAITFIIGYLLTVYLGYKTITGLPDQPYLFFYTSTRPNVMMMSISLFIILKGINYEKYLNNKKKSLKFITDISLCSFGVYFVHTLFIHLVNSGLFGISSINALLNPIIGIPVRFVIIVFLSFTITFLLRKIPIIKYIVP